MTRSTPEPPEDVPDGITTALEQFTDSQVRELIHYAQQLLHASPPLTDSIESREGEELVRMEDYGTYRLVIVKRPNEQGEARGPFAYRVEWEPAADDTEGKYRWHYLGKVFDASGGE